MLELLGETQRSLLKILARNFNGLTVDQLAEKLSVSRNAVNQHLASLEKNQLIKEGTALHTAGRPSRTFTLSERGKDLFPKQYPWFSELILQTIKDESGAAGLSKFLKGIARKLASNIRKDLKGKNLNEKVGEVAAIMQSLSYDASVSGRDEIEATNCVYHHLAQKHSEVCDFDIELLSHLLDAEVTHKECMAKGQGKCRFSFVAKK